MDVAATVHRARQLILSIQRGEAAIRAASSCAASPRDRAESAYAWTRLSDWRRELAAIEARIGEDAVSYHLGGCR